MMYLGQSIVHLSGTRQHSVQCMAGDTLPRPAVAHIGVLLFACFHPSCYLVLGRFRVVCRIEGEGMHQALCAPQLHTGIWSARTLQEIRAHGHVLRQDSLCGSKIYLSKKLVRDHCNIECVGKLLRCGARHSHLHTETPPKCILLEMHIA